ncbi:MAG: FKBP-type peptidyl-prolyl cis-trans isomerase [Prevotella sp.]|nr:FKBP-type peptidyl-prolyl cis-trans isomerase [Prevotella sp.]
MKKVIALALAALVVGASFSTLDAKKKKDKKKDAPVAEVLAPVVLANGCDSMSYAAGGALTNGLIPYLLQQGVDTAYMADFVTGLRQGIAQQKIAMSDPQEKARILGGQIANQLMQGMLPNVRRDFTDTPDTLIEDVFFRGFTDAVMADTTVMTQKRAEALFKEKQKVNKEAKTEKLTRAGREFLEENGKKEGVITTASGLQYKVLTEGDGDVPQRTDKVKVHYEGRLIDGTVFDASSKHGTEPASFRADQVIKGWTEALTMMPVGSKWQLFIPQHLAYGERQTGQIPPYSTLIFDVELVDIEKPEAKTEEKK